MVMTLAEALATSNPRIGIFVRLDIDPPARFWLGVGDCRVGIDATDGTGAIYNGLGEVLNLPAFQQLVNGTAERVEFNLAGVSQRVLQLASTEADDVKGVALLIGIGVFGSDWQMLGNPTWIRRFTVDYLTVEYDQPPGGTPTRTISLSARTFFTGRRRPPLGYYTDYDQQRISPTDRFCERCSIYSQEVTKVWPRY